MFITGGATTSAGSSSIIASSVCRMFDSTSRARVMAGIGSSGSSDDAELASYGCLSGSMFL